MNRYQAPKPGEVSGVDLTPSLLANRQKHDDRLWRTITEVGQRPDARADPIWRDMFALLYKVEPEIVGQAPPQLTQEWEALRRMRESGVFTDLRPRTRLHPLFSWLASEEIAQQVKGLVEQIDLWQEKKMDLGGVPEELFTAVRAAEKRLDDADDAMEQLGLNGEGGGLGRGIAEGEVPSRKHLEAALRFMRTLQNQRFLDLFTWIGRLRPIARRSRDEHWTNKPRRLVGVTTGNHIPRQTPYTRMLYSHPATRPLWMVGQVERRNQEYKLGDREVLAKGPMIVCLDKSGSMNDRQKDPWATAVCLQLQQLAQQDKRDFAVVPYHACAFGCDNQVFGTPDWKPYLFPKGKENGAQFLEIYSRPPNGAATITWQALSAAWTIIDQQPTYKPADIVVITDGAGGLLAMGDEVRAECQRRGVRLWVVLTLDGDLREARAITDEEYILTISDLTSAPQNRNMFDRLHSA